MPFFLKKRKSRFSLGSSGSSDASSRPARTPPTASPTVASYDSSTSSEGRKPHTRLVQLPREADSGDSPRSVQYAPSDLAFSGLRIDKKLRVIVVGTGFAGLSAAIACARQGFAVTVLERSSGISPHGDSILFGSNASKLLMRWGVGKEMYGQAASKGGWWLFKDKEGERIWHENVGEFSAKYGAPILQGRRAAFLGSLGVEGRLLGVQIRLDSEVVKYWDAEDDPAVVLRGGEVVRGDVIIAADGVHSVARQLLAPRDRPAKQRKPSGYSIHRSAISAEAVAQDPLVSHLLDGQIRTWLGPDSHVCLYPMDNGRSLAFTFTHRDAGHSASLDWRDRKPIDEVLSSLHNWDPVLQQAIGYFPTSLHWEILDEPPEEEWISEGGKICFVGDSVHGMMPTSFQGGSQAVEDGATIALCLALAGGDADGVGLALETFQRMRRARVEEAQALGRKQQDAWHRYTTTSPRPPPNSLRPISFDLYDHDAEASAISHFARYARQVDPSFHSQRAWLERAAKKAGLRVVTKN
ncbi:hypothetical protein NBRC10513v2_007760 [Rhodotorula toruloides]|uniref:BY PROTMAP: gi/472583828/gb/EMS21452.1/ monooxygenase [Rhodosporidium toruloides NP11] gi/647402245/emb/CDR48527.1/ RHTO0S18e02014g1_1 [Rhodosporidium toruloides] n=1 Tax=Rhodotorula toruloides TaxID=5286 RepID=A0A0K3CCW4_RHOTO